MTFPAGFPPCRPTRKPSPATVFLRRVPVRGFGECLQHAPLEAVVRRFELLRQDGLAFDHSAILCTALLRLR